MLFDLVSFVVGGAVGAGAALIAWILSRRRWAADPPVVVPAAAQADPPVPPPAWLGSLRPSAVDLGSAPAPVVVSVDQVRLSERVVIALAREGRLVDDAPARPGRTQAGLATALGSNQSAVSKVLRRLVAAELLTEQRRHVHGGRQRVKVYALTRRGELLARDIAGRRRIELLPNQAPAPRAEEPPRLRAR